MTKFGNGRLSIDDPRIVKKQVHGVAVRAFDDERLHEIPEGNRVGTIAKPEQRDHVITSYSIHYTKLYELATPVRPAGERDRLVE